ncbi:MAG: TniQ family protein [Roseiarcus sp.]
MRHGLTSVNQAAWVRRLEPMEPAVGFGARLAALNRKPLRAFLSEFRINPREIDKGDEDAIRALAFVGRADPDALVRFSPIPGAYGEFARVAGETLDRLQLRRTYFRFCPHCVAEDLGRFDGPRHTRPWLRLPWVIGHFRTCNIHHVALAAAQPIRHRFEPFDFAETIASFVLSGLADAVGRATETAPSSFQDWLVARFEGRRYPSNWLDAANLHAAANFAEALGLSMLHPPKVRTSELADLDWAEAADAGYRVAAAGPKAIRDALAGLNRAQAHTRGFWGLRDTYGYAYGLLQKTLKDPAYEPFREIVREFALETMPIEPGTDVLGVKVEARRVHTVRSAAMASGAHARTIRRYFERQGFVGERAASGVADHRATVPAEEIERIARELKGALSTPQVSHEFGVPRIHLTRLIGLGYLRPITDSAERRYGKHRFTHESVEQMLDRLFDGAVDVARPTGRQAPLGDARHIANCTLDEVYESAFGGKLAWKGLLGGRREYGALLVDADELTRIVRDKPKRNALSREEFKQMVPGLGMKTVQFLVDRKLVIETEEYSPDARRMIPVITVASAEAFKARYVALGELAAGRKLHFKQVLSVLDRAGVRLEFEPDEAGCFIFDRKAAERHCNKAPRAPN